MEFMLENKRPCESIGQVSTGGWQCGDTARIDFIS